MGINHEFINSKGVFQGGGCKAVAFIGAYESALQMGVCFTEFAGTSAGAIFAALIASGATVEEMKSFIDGLDIEYLIHEAQKNSKKRNGLLYRIIKYGAKKLKHIQPSTTDMLLATVLDKGMCDANVLEKIIETELKKILNFTTQVRFSDLKFPLTIIASDIIEHKVKIWNKELTPNDSVAKAVSCSCAIPGYFKPVDGRYLDGGLLSNLPISFFDDNAETYSNILAFTLSYEGENTQKYDISNYAADIISTIIEGATNIQMSSHSNIFIVPVKTKIGLLDFSSLDVNSESFKSSVHEGKISFIDFLNNHKKNHETRVRPMHSNQYLQKVASCSCEENDEIICLIDNYKKIFKLFLTILKWKNKSKKISIYIQNKDVYGNDDFDYSVRLLSHMGIKVFIVNRQLPLLGYFFCKSNRWQAVVVRKFENNYKAQYYNSDIENSLAKAYIKSLKNVKYKSFYKQIKNISIKRTDLILMIRNLKNVDQYKQSVISFKKLKLEDLYFMHDYVYGYKYRAMDELVNLYNKANLDLFLPASFVLADNRSSIITPPIVESHDGKYVVISGLTRLFYLYKQSIKEVIIALVENCNEELPTNELYKVNKLRIKDGPLDLEEMVKRNYQHYRRIEQKLRAPASSLI